jgi:hypothetical protein
MPLAVTLEQPFVTEEQKFQTGLIRISGDAWFALAEGCGYAFWALMTAHVRNIKLKSTTQELHDLNVLAIAGDGDEVVTHGRIGNGRLFQVCTRDIHGKPESFVDVVEVIDGRIAH